MKLRNTVAILGLASLMVYCSNKPAVVQEESMCQVIDKSVATAQKQIGFQTELIEKSGKILNPRTTFKNDIEYIPREDWTSGFFPGSMWYMYDLTGDEKWKELGIKYTEDLESAKNLKWHHDIGFIINSSFGNALRVTKNEAYKAVMIEAANSLATRFREVPGVFQSWDEDRGWQGERGWMCPVIIDNMMNLELMFEASILSGDDKYKNMAIRHADATMEHHYRADNSCYHVVDYDKVKGGVRGKYTAQGYADESIWARGQAWGLYGYAMCYRYTKDEKYLTMAKKIYDLIFNHPNMPEDLVPYWDLSVPEIPNTPRDVSAASTTASALYELSEFVPEYKETADKIIRSLASDRYTAIIGTNGNFLLMHSVGSIPHHNEIDVPLNYADYYYLEALTRKRALDCK